MENFKHYFISFLFLFVFAVLSYAQTVRYVAYFPVPYVSHQTIQADKSLFAGKDGAKVEVAGTFQANNLNTSRDLELKSTAASSFNVKELNVGTLDSGFGDTAWVASGDFVVDKEDGKIILQNLPTPYSTGAVNANEVKADEQLDNKNILWKGTGTGDDSEYDGFKRGNISFSTTALHSNHPGFPMETKRLCWVPLRLKGSYEYQYYLIAVNSSTCPN